MENGIKPGSMGSVTMNVAVQPHTNGAIPEELRQSLADGLTVMPVGSDISAAQKHQAIVSQAEIIEPEPQSVKNGPTIPADSMLADIRSPHTEKTIEFPILSPGKDSFQDTVATQTIAEEASAKDDLLLPAARLKRQIENTKDLIVCPGVYDGFSARIALSVGFDALYMVRSIPDLLFSSYAFTVSRLVQAQLPPALVNLISALPTLVTCGPKLI